MCVRRSLISEMRLFGKYSVTVITHKSVSFYFVNYNILQFGQIYEIVITLNDFFCWLFDFGFCFCFSLCFAFLSAYSVFLVRSRLNLVYWYICCVRFANLSDLLTTPLLPLRPKGGPLEKKFFFRIFFYLWDFWPLLVHPMKIFIPPLWNRFSKA